MLTIKAPLELKCNPAIISSHEAFYHRITGNYGLLSAGIGSQDLLHLVTAPLELYLEEGGAVRIAENTNIHNRQETKLEIVNNLLNRITVMGEASLTYQDRVFITDVLRKLGVREVERFMGEVFRLKQETRTTERLIGLYWNHLEELRDRVELYHSREKERQTVEEQTTGRQEEIVLDQKIMNRLQTGAIYQILNNFQQSHTGNSLYVTRQELQISEQKRVAVQILLQRLRQEVTQETLPLVYRHEDGYRLSDPEEDSSMEAWAVSQISSSVLLNLIDNLYLSLFERQRSRTDLWLSMENALYQSAENTLYRLKTGFYDQRQATEEQNLWNIRRQQLKEQEIYLAQALLQARREAEERFSVLWNEYGEQTWQLLEEARADISYPEAGEDSRELPKGPEGEKGDGKPRDTGIAAERREKGVQAGEDFGMRVAAQSEKGREQPESGEYAERQEELFKAVHDVQERYPEQEKGAGEEVAKAEIHFLTGESHVPQEQPQEQSVRELVRRVEESREQFYRMAEQYLQVSHRENRESKETFRIREDSGGAGTLTEKLAGEASREETVQGKDQDRAAAAETVLLRWQEANQEPLPEGKTAEAFPGEEPLGIPVKTPGEAAVQEALREAEKLSPPREAGDMRSVEILHSLEERRDQFYLPGEEPSSAPASREESAGELEQQIHQINRQNLERLELFREIQKNLTPASGKKPGAQRDMRRDSLKALQDPEGLLKEYEEEWREGGQEEQKRSEKLMELLPVQTRRVYERLEEYLGASKEGAIKGPEATDSMGMLLRDIRQAQTLHRETQESREEDLRRIRETSETVLEKWGEAATSQAESSRTFRQEQENSRISLIHKSNQQQIDQEMLDYLMEQNRITQGKSIVTHEETLDRETVNRTLHQQTRQVVNRETEDLTEMIQKGVRQQMGVLSEQIYSKLEKRLQNEKKRRGF